MVRFLGLTKKETDDLKKIGKFAKDSWGKHPPEGLQPIGGPNSGWSGTVDPVDPQNCQLYPDSPWCGGNPFGSKAIDFNIDVGVDNCNQYISVKPTIAFVKFPMQVLAHRNPTADCNPPQAPPLPQPTNGSKTLTFPNVWAGASVYALVGFDTISLTIVEKQNGQTRTLSNVETNTFTNYGCPGTYHLHKVYFGSGENDYTWYDSPVNGQCHSTTESEDSDDPGVYEPIDETNTVEFDTNAVYYRYGIAADGSVVWEDTGSNTQKYYYYPQPYPTVIDTIQRVGNTGYIFSGLWGTILLYLSAISAPSTASDPGTTISASLNIHVDFVVDYGCQFLPKWGELPPSDPRKCCMSCCTPSNSDSDLLRKILSEIQKANTAIGSDEWPAKVPANILVRQGLSNAQISIPNLTQFFEWYVKQFDAVVGRFGIDIQVQDSDPTTPGDQPLKMNLPNLAESVAEMVGLLLHISMTVDSLQNINIRNLVETGSSKQQSFVNYLYLKALSDYMGFPRNDKSAQMTLSFKPNETALDKLLVDTQIQVRGIEYNTSKPRLKDNLQDLLHAAAIIKALHWRKIDPQGDIKSQLFNLIKTQAANALNIGQNVDPKTGKSDFDQFIQDFEDGFQEYTNLDTDLETNPYGRPYAQRPQVKKLGDPNAGTSNQQPGTNISQ